MSKKELINLLIIICSFNLIKSYLKFNIPSDYDKCFNQEIYIEGSLLVKYDLSGFEKEYQNNAQTELFQNIKVFIKNEQNKNIYETQLKSRKEKFVIKIKEAGHYQVCTRYYKPRRRRELSKNILMALKIRTDYEYKNIDDTLKKDDVNNFWKRINDIKKDLRPSIQASLLELNEEDKTAKSIISSINIYYKLCFLQLAVIICLTGYNLYSYKDYFKKLSII